MIDEFNLHGPTILLSAQGSQELRKVSLADRMAWKLDPYQEMLVFASDSAVGNRRVHSGTFSLLGSALDFGQTWIQA